MNNLQDLINSLLVCDDNERESIQGLNVAKKRVLKKDGFSNIILLALIFVIVVFIIAFFNY